MVGSAYGVETAPTLIHATRPDLVFLDLEMIQGNAFDMLNRLQPISFQVIFVTAFDNYAVRAFRYSAVDYLLKPLDINRLVAAVEKVSGKVEKEKVMAQMKMLLENLGNISLSHIFYRIHNSHIINLQKIKNYQKGRGGSVIVEDNSNIEVVIRRRDEFISRLLK